MSKNKNQLARFRRIHELLSLRKGAVITAEEICRACDISRRTLDNDLAFMREELEAPIVWDKKRLGYCYEHPFDLAAQIALNIEDVHRLHVAVETLAQFEHVDVFRELRGTVEKIRKGVSGWVRSAAAAKAIYFEPAQYAGTAFLPVLLRAIEERRTVAFDYQSFLQDRPQRCQLDPYCIRQYDQRWYVIGRSPQYDYLKPFALDRIAGKPELTKQLFDPPNFQPEQYFRHIYGMHTEPPEQALTVRLWFNPLQARFFQSRPFHPYTLVETRPDGSIVVEMQVCATIELVRKLASYGPEVSVLAPDSLQATMRTFFEQALERVRGAGE